MTSVIKTLRCTRASLFLTLVSGLVLLPQLARAATSSDPILDIGATSSVANRPLVLLLGLAAVTLLPFIFMQLTSFIKIAVVLSIVRQAVGTQQIPPTQVITGLAISLTMYIMMPVFSQMYHLAEAEFVKIDGQHPSEVAWKNLTAGKIVAVSGVAGQPLKDFLIRHASVKDRNMFYKLAWRLRTPAERADLSTEDWSIVIPSFVITELKEAFQIGFILFVPFVVIDMIVSNILMALGMQMLSPTTISLPFKILLFVLVDGWYLITQGVILGYV